MTGGLGLFVSPAKAGIQTVYLQLLRCYEAGASAQLCSQAGAWEQGGISGEF